MLNGGERWVTTVSKQQSAQGKEVVCWMELGHRVVRPTVAVVEQRSDADEHNGGGRGAYGDDSGQPGAK
jgi:hypothetical protein